MRLDRNSLTLFNYALLGVFVLVITINDVYANIFDDAPSVSSRTALSCDFTETPSEIVSRMSESINPTYQTPYRVGQLDAVTFPSSNSCTQWFSYKWTSWSTYSDGTRYNERENEQRTVARGKPVEVPSCLNLEQDQNQPISERHSYMGTTTTGEKRCFKPKDIPEYDSCEAKDDNNAYMSYMSKENGVTCLAKNDGSVCPVKKDTSITLNSTGDTYNFYSFDTLQPSDTCYSQNDFGMNQSEPVDEIANNMPQGEGQCSQVNGIDTAQICNENPSNVCDQNGNCSTAVSYTHLTLPTSR